MRVFVALCDVESTTGGGQTVYRQIFRRYPRIDFTYLLESESAEFPRPPNVHGVRLGRRYVRNSAETSLLMECFCWANTIAETLRGLEFDVIEIPDFMSDYCLLPAALMLMGRKSTIAVSLHGQSSRTLELEWPPVGRTDPARLRAEQLLFGASDVRYGISQSYLDEWLQFSSLPTQFVNPLAWLSFPPLQPVVYATHAPNLHFIGRTERRKGPDLFVETLWRLSRDLYQDSSIIGQSVPITTEVNSNDHLRQMIRARQLNTTVDGRKSPAELLGLFASRSIVLIPSRYDTLNLVALEALLAGCPTVIGSGAGVCRFLKDHLPSLPFTLFDVNDLDAATNQLSELLHSYDVTREKLAVAVKSLENVPLPDLEAVYVRRQHDPSIRNEAVALYEGFQRNEKSIRPSLVRRVKQCIALSPQLSKTLLAMQVNLTSRWSTFTSSQPVWSALQGWRGFQRSRQLASVTSAERTVRLASMQRTTHLFGRRQLWIESMHELIGTDRALLGAAYGLRALRLSSKCLRGSLPSLVTVLNDHGFSQEAKLTEVLYGDLDEPTRIERIKEWLRQRKDVNRAITEIPLGVFDDRRVSAEPRVSILVALQPNDKLQPKWWEQFKHQSLFQQQRAEVIFIEYRSNNDVTSGSSDFMAESVLYGVPAIFLRLSQHATIGQAWNQGLRFARAPSILRLNNNEILRPAALELLVQQLHSRFDLDWVQSNALEVECDSQGHYLNDLAYIDRSDVDPSMIRIDAEAISRTGSLYRRSIHDRCGYFDTSFRVACDLEFVQRALPSIQVAMLPQTFIVSQFEPGTCNDRKLEREIELLRAWDVFRTAAGIEITYGSQTNLLDTAMRFAWAHRPVKSGGSNQALKGDVEYAARLAIFATERLGHSITWRNEKLSRLLWHYRQLDDAAWPDLVSATINVTRNWVSIRRMKRQLTAELEVAPKVPYFHDERFERDRLTMK
jgi:glycosyltransferase involved in cell wall biosynthesis